MKVLFIVLSLLIFDQGCINSKIDQDNLSIEYSAMSRGSYKLIILNKKTISIINKRNAKPIIKECNEKYWHTIMDLVKNIDLENISKLEAPTQKRLYDGAAIANLTITYNGTDYESASFDHGNPPKEIELIVKEILSVSENIEKQ
ncbi:hypothetical protein V8G69_01120 [Gaetbulibacter sp. M235]|uniref:hypothetical protein n=1 Tax=Gaetbulibacter sp. M235 TaxID=3126510 RepID=UPI00374EBCBC